MQVTFIGQGNWFRKADLLEVELDLRRDGPLGIVVVDKESRHGHKSGVEQDSNHASNLGSVDDIRPKPQVD